MTKLESASPTATQTEYVLAPFDGQHGDIILQSSDLFNFRVSKNILGLASPLFGDMLCLPQPAAKDEDTDKGQEEIPIVPLSESSDTLDILLRFCYPLARPHLDQQCISEIVPVLQAARKCDISFVVDCAREAFKNRVTYGESESITGYALACKLNWEAEARVAAVASLQWQWRTLGARIPALSVMSGMDYYNLLDFHMRASFEVESLILDGSLCCDAFPAVKCSLTITPETQCECRSFSNTEMLLKASLMRALKDGPLKFDKISLSTFWSYISRSSCPNYQGRLIANWEAGIDKVKQTILAKIDELELSFSWK